MGLINFFHEWSNHTWDGVLAIIKGAEKDINYAINVLKKPTNDASGKVLKDQTNDASGISKDETSDKSDTWWHITNLRAATEEHPYVAVVMAAASIALAYLTASIASYLAFFSVISLGTLCFVSIFLRNTAEDFNKLVDNLNEPVPDYKFTEGFNKMIEGVKAALDYLKELVKEEPNDPSNSSTVPLLKI